MAPKRSSPEEENKYGRSKLRRCRCKGMTGQKFFTRLLSHLEPMIRTAVQDEVQKLLNHVLPSLSVPRHPNNRIQELSRYQLHFRNTFPSTLFTGREIENLQIIMKDAGLDKIVTSGVFSSLKIKIVVLNGEFCGDGQEVWSEEEFARHILSERPGKPPLLTGELSVRLSNGVGYIVGATFNDNSSWTKRGFRLGAVAFDERVGDTRVRGAVGELFKVKDRRVEGNQKNCPPLLNNEVWHLKNIRKDGPFHKNLMNGGIKTVQDLLRSFVMNPIDLFNISRMPRMKWEATLKHAFECTLGNQLYSFYHGERGLLLIFNSILQLVGANGQGLHLPDFGLTDKEDLVNFAYKNSTGIIPFHGIAFHSFPMPFPTLNVTSMPRSIPQISNFQVTSHGTDKSTEVVVLHQLYAPCGEVSNDLSMRPNISHGQEVDSAHHFSSFQTSASIMVQDVVQKLLNHVLPALSVPRHPNHQIQELSRYQLHFGNTFPSTLFTGRAIENLQVFIKDAGLDKIVTSGFFSSVKIKIVVLNGEFCGDGQADWTEEEFVRHILSERHGKPPLLTGELSVSLCNGVGYIVGATFNDNSSWTKRGFRLGAVVFDERVGDARVRGAVSGHFKVKDRRVEGNQKNCPPLLNNEVWNLKNIRKDGPFHKNLMNGGIKTVQDLLRSFVMNPINLFNISRMPRMKWEATLKHAFECALGSQLYSFYYEEKELILIFNSILQLVGAIGQGLYLPDFDLTDKKDLVNFAYKNSAGIIPFHGIPFHSFPMPFPTLNVTSMPRSIQQISNFQVTSHGTDKSTEVGVLHQLYAPCGEISNDLSMRPNISHGQEVDSAHHFLPSKHQPVSGFQIRRYVPALLYPYHQHVQLLVTLQ